MAVAHVRPRYHLFVALALGLVGCSTPRAQTGGDVDRSVLLADDFADRGFHTAYDVVEALRSNWLASRGPNSFQSPTVVQVYLDGIRLGGVETLRTVDVQPIVYIRYFDGVAATARWGLDHGAGAIYVSTHPLGDVNVRSWREGARGRDAARHAASRVRQA